MFAITTGVKLKTDLQLLLELVMKASSPVFQLSPGPTQSTLHPSGIAPIATIKPQIKVRIEEQVMSNIPIEGTAWWFFVDKTEHIVIPSEFGALT